MGKYEEETANTIVWNKWNWKQTCDSIVNIVSFFLLFSFALFIFWGDALLGARLLMIGNPGRVSNTVPSYYKAVVMYILF